VTCRFVHEEIVTIQKSTIVQQSSPIVLVLERERKFMPRTAQETGAMGLPLTVIGEAVQSITRQAVDRGNVTHERMIEFLTNAYDEDEFWERFGGPATDWFENSVSGET
jgi:hypothetical protein